MRIERDKVGGEKCHAGGRYRGGLYRRSGHGSQAWTFLRFADVEDVNVQPQGVDLIIRSSHMLAAVGKLAGVVRRLCVSWSSVLLQRTALQLRQRSMRWSSRNESYPRSRDQNHRTKYIGLYSPHVGFCFLMFSQHT